MVPTAAGLVNLNVEKCVFCASTRVSKNCLNCFSFQQKKHILKEKNACFRCLKRGRQSRKCREKMKCIISRKSHVVLIYLVMNSPKKCSE